MIYVHIIVRRKTSTYLTERCLEFNFKSATWSYFNRGTADGVGGTLKQIADRIVANGNDVKDDADFYRLVKTQTNVKLFLVSEDERYYKI